MLVRKEGHGSFLLIGQCSCFQSVIRHNYEQLCFYHSPLMVTEKTCLMCWCSVKLFMFNRSILQTPMSTRSALLSGEPPLVMSSASLPQFPYSSHTEILAGCSAHCISYHGLCPGCHSCWGHGSIRPSHNCCLPT